MPVQASISLSKASHEDSYTKSSGFRRRNHGRSHRRAFCQRRPAVRVAGYRAAGPQTGRASVGAKPFRAKRFRSNASAPGFKSGGTISNSTHGNPALAKCAAIRAPIVPAPSTTAFCMEIFIRTLSATNWTATAMPGRARVCTYKP